MLKIYKFISTVKAKDPKDKQATHYLSAKENQGDQNGELVASLWSKSMEKDGVKKAWLSGEMKAQYTDHTDSSKTRKGYVIVEEEELKQLLKKIPSETLEEDTMIQDNDPF